MRYTVYFKMLLDNYYATILSALLIYKNECLFIFYIDTKTTGQISKKSYIHKLLTIRWMTG